MNSLLFGFIIASIVTAIIDYFVGFMFFPTNEALARILDDKNKEK